MTRQQRGMRTLTPDIAYAIALDHVYGNATKPRQWPSLDEREEEFWSRLRNLLGNPSDENLGEMLWEHREAIGRMNHRVIAHSLHNYAKTECRVDNVSGVEQRRLASARVLKAMDSRGRL